MKVKIRKRYEYIKTEGENNNGKKITESSGYIKPKKRIEDFFRAGQQLKAYRQEQFDFPDGTKIDDEFEDPTRRTNFDLTDVTEISNDINNKIRSKKNDVKKQDINMDSADSNDDISDGSIDSSQDSEKGSNPKKEDDKK